jgi:hypothetical protein
LSPKHSRFSSSSHLFEWFTGGASRTRGWRLVPSHLPEDGRKTDEAIQAHYCEKSRAHKKHCLTSLSRALGVQERALRATLRTHRMRLDCRDTQRGRVVGRKGGIEILDYALLALPLCCVCDDPFTCAYGECSACARPTCYACATGGDPRARCFALQE